MKFQIPIGPQHPALKEPISLRMTVEGEVIAGSRSMPRSGGYRLLPRTGATGVSLAPTSHGPAGPYTARGSGARRRHSG